MAVQEPQTLTARVYGTPIEPTGYFGLRFRGTDFIVSGSPARLEMRAVTKGVGELALDQLIDILFDRRALTVPSRMVAV